MPRSANESRMVASRRRIHAAGHRDTEVRTAGCTVCGKEEAQEATVEYGTVTYKKWGAMFTQMADEPNRTAHLKCLVTSGVFLEHLEVEQCAMCGEQFYPRETVIKFETHDEIGYAHWACVAESTNFPVDVE